MTTPIERLREQHRPCSVPCFTHSWVGDRAHCAKCSLPDRAYTWPCDTIAALDALEEGLHNLQARIAQADALAAVVQIALNGHYWANNAEQRADPLGYLQSRVEDLADKADTALRDYLEWLKGEGQ